jgi:predicted peptidase
MRKLSRRQFMRTAALTGVMTAAVAGGTVSAEACISKKIPAEGSEQTVTIEGFAWGPSVTATVIELADLVKPGSVQASDFVVTEKKESFDWATLATEHIVSESQRTVTNAVVSTADGKAAKWASRYVRLELDTPAKGGSPFCYDLYTSKNTWCDPYSLEVKLADGVELTGLLGKKITEINVKESIDFAAANIPEMDAFDTTGTFTASDGKTLRYASYTPKSGDKLPLVIWLHGAGEGGEDPSILLLGNEVTPLAESEFQTALGGAAYILTPQTPGFWLEYDEEGNWSDNPGVPSIYTKALKELIDAFVAENPRIDANRIIIGGCSNGGYMTVNMVLQYPDYFAAAYPICEAYKDSGITDAQLAAVKDLPLWFVYAENDTTVTPSVYEAPTIARLKALGADVKTSIFADVHDTTGLYKQEDGTPYQYSGHWSWTYFFKNACVDDATGENMWTWLGKQSK